jgi:hypothetical protein
MTSSLVEVVNIEDNMVSNIQTNLKYGVYNGCQSITPQTFPAQSKSNNGLTFTVQMPSETTMLRPRMMLRVKPQLTLSLSNNTGGALTIGQILGYGGMQSGGLAGVRSALAPFPVHNLMTTMTLTLNNNTFDLNVNQCVHAFMRLVDFEKSRGFNSTTPTMQDYLQSYTDLYALNIDPLSSFGNSSDILNQPRGAFNCTFDPALSTSVANGATQAVDVTFETSEPLMLSPFTWIEDIWNRSGMYGIQTMNLQINLDTSARRAFRYSGLVGTAPNTGILVGEAGIYNVTVKDILSADLDLVFLTPKPSTLLPPINCHPYCQFMDYHKTDFSIADGAVGSLISSTITLNQVPDGIFVGCKKSNGSQKINDTDSYLPFGSDKPLNITFNNAVGLLSTANKQELFQRAYSNGVYQPWSCFDEQVNVFSSTGSSLKNSCGGLLYLRFGKDIQIPELYLSPGSIGQYQLQVQLAVKNNTGSDINSNNVYDFFIIVVNSGNCIIERGSTTTYTGVLTKEKVLEAMAMPPYSSAMARRVIGGGFFDTLKSVISGVKNIASPLLDVASMIPIPGVQKVAQMGKMGVNVADKLGFGMTGGKDKRLA